MPDKKIRVLLVDDQALVLEILKRGISKEKSIEVVGTATDGYLALNQINRVKPDVIVLDLEMPRMNGIQFLHNLMPVRPIPTLILSALTEDNTKITEDAFNAGAVDFLQKPSAGSKGLNGLIVQLWAKIKMAATKDVSHFKKRKQDYKLPDNHLDRSIKTNKHVLGMGAHKVINEPNIELKIFALGSCIGLGMYCPSKQVVGLCHVALPNSKTDIEKSIKVPGYFADSAIKAMINDFLEFGCPKEKIFAKISGGAKTRVELGDYFAIGQKNSIAVKAGLIKNGIKVLSEDTGGTISRTCSVMSGETMMKLNHPEKGNWEI